MAGRDTKDGDRKQSGQIGRVLERCGWDANKHVRTVKMGFIARKIKC